MICVVCEQDLADIVDGQYAHAACQLHLDWKPSTTAWEIAVDEAIATGLISRTTDAAVSAEIRRDFKEVASHKKP